MKILLVAYACEPGKGSEQGTGWNLACRLAEHHEVTVVTRSNNRPVIEADGALAGRPGLAFLYHDLSPRMLRWKSRGLLPVQSYYALWLLSLARRIGSEPEFAGHDVVHHLTFNSFEIPPLFLRGAKGLKVWGPVGGGQIPAAGLRPFFGGKARWKEWLRAVRVRVSEVNPWVTSTLEACDLVLFANEETRARMEANCRGRTGVMIDVGVDPATFSPAQKSGDGKQVLFAGKFEPRKGVRLLLEAFAKALELDPGLRLRLVGDGPGLAADREFVRSAGLDAQVVFTGRRNHGEMAEEFSKADVFVFPSLRDTSGAIVLEAMASGLPTVCLDHQGARLMVDEGSGLRVDPDGAVAGMARAIARLAADSGERERMGAHARARAVSEFSWESKTARLLREYRLCLEDQPRSKHGS